MTRTILILSALAIAVTAPSCKSFQTGPLDESPLEDITAQVEQGDLEGELPERTLVILSTQLIELTLSKPKEEPEEEPDEDDEIYGFDDLDEEEEEDPIEDLTVGHDEDFEYRLFLIFDLDTLPAGVEITSAAVELTSTDNVDGSVELVYGAAAAAWAPDKISWDSQPVIVDETVTTLSAEEDNLLDRLDILPIVKKWVSDEMPNHGIVIKAIPEEYETYKSYHSPESGKVVAGPRLVINYRGGPRR